MDSISTTAASGGGLPSAIIPIRQAELGKTIGRRRIAVTKRMTMAYAAGIGADDPCYLDDAREGGPVAPLSFLTSLEWQVMMAPDYLSAVGRDETTAYNGLVHAFQDSTFLRPVRPGDELEVFGQIVEQRATSAGTLVVCRITTLDQPTGQAVGVSWFGAMYRGTPLDGRPAVWASRPPPPDWLETVARGGSTEIAIPRRLPHVYSECASIWNPIHTERAFALASGLPDIILHGTCTWAMAMQRLAAAFGRADALPFRRFAARFSRMVIPGHPVLLEHSADSGDGASFVVRNHLGMPALTQGLACWR